MNIGDVKIKLFCPFCGKELERYGRDNFNKQGYGFCSNCDREYVLSSSGESEGPQMLFIYWKDGDKKMWEWKKKEEEREAKQ